MGFKAIGENLAIAHLMGTREKFEEGLKEAASDAGDVLVRTAHEGMDSASSPSAPGEYPANETGNLRAGINYNATTNALYFRSSAPHAHLVEDGTPGGTRTTKKKGFFGRYSSIDHPGTDPRPVIKLAAEEADSEVDKILKDKPFKRIS